MFNRLLVFVKWEVAKWMNPVVLFGFIIYDSTAL